MGNLGRLDSVLKVAPPNRNFLSMRIGQVLDAAIFSNFGPLVRLLEKTVAHLLEVEEDQVVAASSATLALEGCVATSGIRKWEVPSFSFPAAPLSIKNAGSQIRFVDVDDTSWWALGSSKHANPKHGLLTVAPFGAGLSTPDGNHQEIIIDAAASLANSVEAFPNLPGNAMVVFSLHATKPLGGGEGGLVVFGSSARAKEFRAWTNFGFVGRRESDHVGTNGKMSEFDAAAVMARLDDLNHEVASWRRARAIVTEVETGARAEMFHRKKVPELGLSPYWIVRFPGRSERNSAQKALTAAGIDSRLWWGEGVHRMSAFSGLTAGILPVTDELVGQYLGLPFHREIQREAAQQTMSVLEKIVN